MVEPLTSHNFEVQQSRRFVASPPLVVQEVNIGENRIRVVRDDLLPGGTKQRGLFGLLKDYERKGYTRFSYVSPFCSNSCSG